MVWLRFTLTGVFLLIVLYFQFFFDFSSLIDEGDQTNTAVNQSTEDIQKIR
jgi:hypothetical protein